MSSITNLEPLCAMVMLRMTHAQLLQTLFAEEDTSIKQAADAAVKLEGDKEEPAGCVDDSSCHDFAALTEGQLSIAAVYRLSSHIRTCDGCKYLFAMICDVRQGKALDSFEDRDE